MNDKIKVLIADDHEIVRTGLANVLDFEDDIEVVGTAKNGLVAVRMAAELKPDIIVMDLVMPVLGGADATERIKASRPEVKILVLTSYDSPEEIRRALDAGASGALLKSMPNRDILKAIRQVAHGKEIVADEIAAQLATAPEEPILSPRQIDILKSITLGLSNQDIATQLGVSRGSVKKHLAVVFDKLGAATRAEAVATALRRHLLKA